MTAPTPPGWYPDRDPRQVRWFDGRQWTRHVRPTPSARPQQRAGVGGVVGGGGGTLFTEPVLVVNQKAKMW